MTESVASDGRLLVGRYRLDRLLGHGGMGWVWAAHDETLGRDVAVKEVVPPPDLTPEQREMIRRRTLREARAAARIAHPSAVTVYDVVEEDGRPYIVMQLLPQRTLADVLTEDGPLPPARAARIGLDLVDALETAHAAGVLHRDVKPANVMLTESGRAVLTDFGIATVEDDPTLTTTGMLVGSPAYMAPERARGERPTPAADLWSLGATLFAAVEGEPPFRREGQLPTLNAVLTEQPPAAEHGGPMRAVIAALLTRDPAVRPTAPQARELLLRAAEAATAQAERTEVIDPGVASAPTSDSDVEPEPATRTDAGRAQASPAQTVPVLAAGPEAEEQTTDRVDRDDTSASPPEASVSPSAPGAAPVVAPRESDGDGLAPPSAAPPSAAPPSAAPPSAAPPGAAPAWSEPVRGRRPRALLAAAIVLALAFAAFGLARLLGGGAPGGSSTGATSTAGQSGGTSAGGSAGASPSAQPTDDHGGSGSSSGASASPSSGTATGGSGGGRSGQGSGASAVPAGFRRWTDPTGFSLVIPSGWTVTRKGTDVTFHQPGGRAFLLVPQTTHPAADSLVDWQDQERAASPHFPGYQRIRLERVSFHRGWDVADWEFRWTPSGGTLHVLDRNLRISDRRAYALYWSVPEQDWTRMSGTFTVIANSFRPAP
jgi:eukaryotic-like serine/threonine-protein kinase